MDASAWPEWKRRAWLANLTRAQAEWQLRFGRLEGLSCDQIYSLALTATEDPDYARKLKMRFYLAAVLAAVDRRLA